MQRRDSVRESRSDDPTFLYRLSTRHPKCSAFELISAIRSPYLDISHSHTPPFPSSTDTSR
jgi:hypothetical protein